MFLSKLVLAALLLRWAGADLSAPQTNTAHNLLNRAPTPLRDEISSGMFWPAKGPGSQLGFSDRFSRPINPPTTLTILTPSGAYLLTPQPCPIIIDSFQPRHFHAYFSVLPIGPTNPVKETPERFLGISRLFPSEN
jgi:hypothetical protein